MPLISGIKPVTHCIFDNDGLLLNTETIYEKSIGEICRLFGKDYPLEVRFKVLGTVEPISAAIVIKELSLPISVVEFVKLLNELVQKKFPTVKMMRGAERLVRHLHQSNIPICVGTSSAKEVVELKMQPHSDLYKLFSHVVTGTDPEVKNGKPAPDIFLVAASRFKDKPDPSKCLVFEDSPNGVKAAIAAGMQAVMIPDKRVSAEKKAEATIVLESLEDFQPELFGLPKFSN